MTSRTPHARLLTVGAVALLSVGLTGCASSTAGSGRPASGAGGASSSPTGGSTSGGSGGASGSSGSGAQPASDITALAAQLVAGTSRGTTVHLTLATQGGGTTADASGNGEGDVKTADGGTTQAFSFAVGTGSTAISLVYVDGAAYVKLPVSEQTDKTKPWAKVSSTSSNPVVKAISGAFDQIGGQTSLTQYAALVKGASNFKATGAAEVGGTAVQGYSFDVDPKNLPNAKDLGAAVSQIGPIPTTMAVDDQGRPVQVVEKISVAGQSITTTVTFSDYGKATDITAPPAAQTSTG